MSILINKHSKVLCQGITGRAGSFHARLCRDYGTQMVGGVAPGKGGQFVDGMPVFDTIQEAVSRTGADVSMIFVPAPFAKDAILEAADGGIQTIVVITEGIPIHDMALVKERLCRNRREKPKPPGREADRAEQSGLISVEACKVGIMPGAIHRKGSVGVVSRSGTLTYEAVYQLSSLAVGQSTVVGIGGDPIVGTSFVEILELFEADPDTNAVLLLGEIGGQAEEDAALFFKQKMKKPLFSYIAGRTAPPQKRMGHAGAIVEGGSGGAQNKIRFLKEKGVVVIDAPDQIGRVVKTHLGGRSH